ncbi:MAG: hypothetical protein M1827_006933 [Pycnora praestabilis]|nr:MAG: hypothetical protein M1827_006933 [Pycnora praestabilis]
MHTYPGGYSSCAIAVFPFPITGEGADTDRWLWIKRYGAGRIISKCQMGKVFGEGGYYYGFGEDNNIAIVVFQMTRPEDVAPNTTPTLTEGAWEQLYGYVESATFGSSNIAYIDPDEPGTSSSHENLAAAAQPLTNIQATWTEEDLPVTDRGPQDMIDGLPRDFVTWMNDPSISTPEKGIGCGLSYCFDHADCGWGGFGGGRFGCGGCISFSPFQVGMDVLFGVGEAMFARLGRCGKPSTSNASPAQSPPTKPPGGGSSGSDL